MVVCCNFTPVPRHDYRLGVPEACWYEEIFNSDSTYYGGSNLGNGGGIQPCRRKATAGRPRWVHLAAAGGGGVQAAAVAAYQLACRVGASYETHQCRELWWVSRSSTPPYWAFSIILRGQLSSPVWRVAYTTSPSTTATSVVAISRVRRLKRHGPSLPMGYSEMPSRKATKPEDSRK